MCLLDTTDGALMLSLYIQPATNFLPSKPDSQTIVSETEILVEDTDLQTETSPESTTLHNTQNARDPIAFLYFSIVLTTLTVIIAIVIGVIQLLTLVLNVTDATGSFWDGVQTAGDYYDAIGGGICACFLIFGLLSVACYKPWRRWVGQRRADEEEGPTHTPRHH
jgi:high-affinity nickel-transport protein